MVVPLSRGDINRRKNLISRKRLVPIRREDMEEIAPSSRRFPPRAASPRSQSELKVDEESAGGTYLCLALLIIKTAYKII